MIGRAEVKNEHSVAPNRYWDGPLRVCEVHAARAVCTRLDEYPLPAAGRVSIRKKKQPKGLTWVFRFH